MLKAHCHHTAGSCWRTPQGRHVSVNPAVSSTASRRAVGACLAPTEKLFNLLLIPVDALRWEGVLGDAALARGEWPGAEDACLGNFKLTRGALGEARGWMQWAGTVSSEVERHKFEPLGEASRTGDQPNEVRERCSGRGVIEDDQDVHYGETWLQARIV